MIVSGIIWFGSCVGSIASPFFYKTSQAPSYTLGIGSLLVSNVIEFLLFFVLRFSFKWENQRKERIRQAQRENGNLKNGVDSLNATAFQNLTDKENPNFVYCY